MICPVPALTADAALSAEALRGLGEAIAGRWRLPVVVTAEGVGAPPAGPALDSLNPGTCRDRVKFSGGQVGLLDPAV